MSAKVQATSVTYELESLGWKAFQDLCVTIVSDVLGQTVQTFLPSYDGGRDGAFHGTWDARDGTGVAGSFTVQCKFSGRNSTLSLADLKDELGKARRLASGGLSDNYVLMTNLGISGVAEEVIRAEFLAVEGIKSFVLFGRDWITLKIRESSRLRMLVPRVYGLGDLSQILDERAYTQGLEILSALGDDLSKFVVTQAHSRAARALVDHGFVLLLGEPAAGKSTIAASLAIGALDLWGCPTLKIRNADEFVQHWNPHDPRQFFWVDDAFGTTQYQREIAHDWNRTFPHMSTAIRKGTRVLFTSRDYIYRAARSDLKVGAFPLIKESQVVINVQQFERSEKEKILYNHLKLGEQPQSFRTRIKPFLDEVAMNDRFLPEIARRLGNPIFTKGLLFDSNSIRSFVENPIQFLIEVTTNLDAESRAALALIFIRGGALESPISLSEQEWEALAILGIGLPAARRALVALDASLVSLVRTDGKVMWTFKHPTIGDAYASIVAEDPELLDIHMSWASVDKLIAEVTCGDVGLEGVKVVVPQTRFERFIERLREVDNQQRLLIFLASRCSQEFLRLYLKHHPQLGERIVTPGSYLSAVAEVDLLVRLREVDLLPEEWRTQFVMHVRTLALETPDVDFLSISRIRALFTEGELSAILEAIREELLPEFSSIVSDWRYNCGSDKDPEEEFAPLKDLLEVLGGEFGGDDPAQALLKTAEEEVEEMIQYLQEEKWHREEDDDYRYEQSERSSTFSERSIFDDVDQ